MKFTTEEEQFSFRFYLFILLLLFFFLGGGGGPYFTFLCLLRQWSLHLSMLVKTVSIKYVIGRPDFHFGIISNSPPAQQSQPQPVQLRLGHVTTGRTTSPEPAMDMTKEDSNTGTQVRWGGFT